jgi:limonene-1,2-epoxide hydrolase
MSNKDIVDQFFSCWASGDIAGSMANCTDDVVWDNVPMNPIEGKAAVEAFLIKFAEGMSDVRYDIEHVMEDGNRLMLEGVENYTKKGRKVSVRYMASFEFRDNRISAWRDYFDLASVQRQLA